MITINGELKELLRAANEGPFMRGELISLTGRGKVRVICNWLYSSLACNPNDQTPFLWDFIKVSDTQVALSPAKSCISKQIFASVRDDIGYNLQVQAPYSADWITAIQRDEIISLHFYDMAVASLKGFNGAFIALNATPESNGYYRMRSVGQTFDRQAQWYIGVKNVLQSHLQFTAPATDSNNLEQQFRNAGIHVDAEALKTFAKQLAFQQQEV